MRKVSTIPDNRLKVRLPTRKDYPMFLSAEINALLKFAFPRRIFRGATLKQGRGNTDSRKNATREGQQRKARRPGIGTKFCASYKG
jgi:hypothetical protein